MTISSTDRSTRFAPVAPLQTFPHDSLGVAATPSVASAYPTRAVRLDQIDVELDIFDIGALQVREANQRLIMERARADWGDVARHA